MSTREDTIVLFDLDNTLSPPRGKVTNQIKGLLKNLRKKATIGLVGGSDFNKAKEQFGDDILESFDYVFSENGTTFYKDGILVSQHSMKDKLEEEGLQRLINFSLGYMSKIQLPKKRGSFIEYRKGMINVAPPGRSCTQEERKEFYEYDKIHKIREDFIEALERNLSDLNLQYSIGGEISIDVFPKGWSKEFCLQFVPENFTNVYFCGDKTEKGGNDYEIYNHPRVNGYNVDGPDDTYYYICCMFDIPCK